MVAHRGHPVVGEEHEPGVRIDFSRGREYVAKCPVVLAELLSDAFVVLAMMVQKVVNLAEIEEEEARFPGSNVPDGLSKDLSVPKAMIGV
jgi:hypothetical protein